MVYTKSFDVLSSRKPFLVIENSKLTAVMASTNEISKNHKGWLGLKWEGGTFED
jgi:hypothetical protein